MLRLDAYRQAFDALVNSLTTYKPLLTRLKAEYDAALEDALRSSYENIHMRAALAVSEAQLGKVVDAALQVCVGCARGHPAAAQPQPLTSARVQESTDGVAQLREDLWDQLAIKEERARATEAEAAQQEANARELRDQLAHLSRKTAELLSENRVTRAKMLAASSLCPVPRKSLPLVSLNVCET